MSSSKHKNLKILCVDSNKSDLDSLVDLINSVFHISEITAVCCNTHEEAVKAVNDKKHNVDIVLSEIKLSDAKPEEVYKSLLNIFCPVIVVSTIDDEDFILSMMENGVSGFIRKPVKDKTYIRNVILYELALFKYYRSPNSPSPVPPEKFAELERQFKRIDEEMFNKSLISN